MDVTTSAGLDAAHDVATIVVYDAATGAIVHRHYVVTFAGADAPLPAEAEARAIDLAKAHSGFTGAVGVLRVHRDAFAQPARYRVDVKKCVVVSEPLGLKRKAQRRAPRAR